MSTGSDNSGGLVDNALADMAKGLPRDLAIIKMENESMMSIAAAHPRDHVKILGELIAQLNAYPSFARVAIYTKPVGTVNVITCQCGNMYEDGSRDKTGPCPKCEKVAVKSVRKKKKFARGLSIRAAEAIAEVYGYNKIRVNAEEAGEDAVRVSATFMDMQKCRVWEDSGILSKFYKGSDGVRHRHSDDRFLNTVVKAEASRRLREVIIRSVPAGLRAELYEVAEQRMKASLTEDSIDSIVQAFAEYSISRDDLEAIVGRSIGAGWTEDDRLNLKTLYTGLKTGETSRSEIMEGLESAAPAAAPTASGKKVSTLNETVGAPATPSGTQSSASQSSASQSSTTQSAESGTSSSATTAEEPAKQKQSRTKKAPAAQETQPTQTRPAAQSSPETSQNASPAAPANGNGNGSTQAAPSKGASRAESQNQSTCPAWARDTIASLATPQEVDEFRDKNKDRCQNPDEFGGFMTACAERRKSLSQKVYGQWA